MTLHFTVRFLWSFCSKFFMGVDICSSIEIDRNGTACDFFLQILVDLTAEAPDLPLQYRYVLEESIHSIRITLSSTLHYNLL